MNLKLNNFVFDRVLGKPISEMCDLLDRKLSVDEKMIVAHGITRLVKTDIVIGGITGITFGLWIGFLIGRG